MAGYNNRYNDDGPSNGLARIDAASAIQQASSIDPQEAIAKFFLTGKIDNLNAAEQLVLVQGMCDKLGLDPAQRPFQLIKMPGQGLTLYADKGCAEQIRNGRGISIIKLTKEHDPKLGIYTVEATAQDQNGRIDVATGAVFVNGVSGEEIARKIKIAETQAKRRVTFSLCGLSAIGDKLGWTDETPADDVARYKRETAESAPGRVTVDNPIRQATVENLIKTTLPRIRKGDDPKECILRWALQIPEVPDVEHLHDLTESQGIALLVWIQRNCEVLPRPKPEPEPREEPVQVTIVSEEPGDNDTAPARDEPLCADCEAEGTLKTITQGQKTLSIRKYGRPLCPLHQDAARNDLALSA